MKVKVKYWIRGNMGTGYKLTTVDIEKVKSIQELDVLCKKRFEALKIRYNLSSDYFNVGITRDTQTREAWGFIRKMLEERGVK